MDRCVNYSSEFVEKETHLLAVYFLYACEIVVAAVAAVAVEVGAEGSLKEAGCSTAVVSVSEVAGRFAAPAVAVAAAAAAAAAAEDGR